MRPRLPLRPVRSALAAVLLAALLASFPAAAQPAVPGDVNGDFALNVSDVLFLINGLFAGGSIPLGPADANGDGTVNVSDVLYLINHLFAGGPAPAAPSVAWPAFARDAQHTARAPAGSQPLQSIHWQTPVDENPQYQNGSLLAHYSGPLLTAANTVLVTVKTGATDGFRVDARRASDGQLVWSEILDYSRAPADWTPPCGPVLTPSNQVVFPAAGGTIRRRADADAASSTVQRFAFYGLAEYEANTSTYDANVKINTPLTCDRNGTVYFGFRVISPTGSLASGIARVDANGNGTWIGAAAAALDGTILQVVNNGAPALSLDGSSLYVGVRDANGHGYLLRLDASTLARQSAVRLKDPASGNDAVLSNDGTSSPMVGPDGDVYFGIFENPFGSNHARGFLAHFDATLATARIPGAFGWDNTPSVVPAAAVAAYTGASPYLLFSKYNNYAFLGGDGKNRIAILDPFAGASDPVTGITAMKEVVTQIGPTSSNDPQHPDAVQEWCVNSGAIDPLTRSALMNSEDGKLYRWDLTTNTLSQSVTLTPGIFQAYTPTVVGPDGTVYAIQDAKLFAVGATP